jgi:hypothetical protein
MEPLQAASQPRREVVKYILDIIRLIAEKWKPCLNIIHSSIHKLFSNKLDMSQNNVGLQLMGIFLVNDIAPFNQSVTTTGITKETFFSDLAVNIQCHKKEVYQAAAEVIGLCLSHYKTKVQVIIVGKKKS